MASDEPSTSNCSIDAEATEAVQETEVDEKTEQKEPVLTLELISQFILDNPEALKGLEAASKEPGIPPKKKPKRDLADTINILKRRQEEVLRSSPKSSCYAINALTNQKLVHPDGSLVEWLAANLKPKIPNSSCKREITMRDLCTTTSFEQLPDELVALVASYFVGEDVINLLKTNKRTNRLMKRNGFDKPAEHELRFDFTIPRHEGNILREFQCYVGLANGEERVYVKAVNPHLHLSLQDTKENFIASCCDKFRSIYKLTLGTSRRHMFHISDMFHWNSLVAKKKIKCFEFRQLSIRTTSDAFVDFCIRLDEVKLVGCMINNDIITDKTMCKILHTTNIDFSPILSQLNLTDITIDAMIQERIPKKFRIRYRTSTKFTIAGIRRLTEHCCKSGFYFDIKLGMVNEVDAARDWYIMAREAADLPYELRISDFPGYGTILTIVKKEEPKDNDGQRRQITVLIDGLLEALR